MYFPDCQCNVPNNKNMVKFSDKTILDVWNCRELTEYRKFLAAGREKELCKPFCYDGKTVLHYTDHVINVSERFKNCYLK